MRAGNSRTPASTDSLPRSAVGPAWSDVIIAWNLSNSSRACSTVLPLSASVISDADAFEMAQPEPWNATSLITSPSSVTYSVRRSPQSGL